MQQLLMLIDQSLSRGKQWATNIAREYLQVLILKAIYQSPFGRDLSFMGGTCLRLCYNLKRFSEDLDFSLDAHSKRYSFEALNNFIDRRLKELGLPVEVAVKGEKTVSRSFVRFPLEPIGLSDRPGQKLHIKLEVDNHPPPIKRGDREEYFLSRHNELFPLLKHNESTLFAGKVLALMLRPQVLGRDCYDLIWYLRRETSCNFTYLNAGLHTAGEKVKKIQNRKDLLQAVENRMEGVSGKSILEDIEAFLEDSSEADWLRRYPEVFLQFAK